MFQTFVLVPVLAVNVLSVKHGKVDDRLPCLLQTNNMSWA